MKYRNFTARVISERGSKTGSGAHVTTKQKQLKRETLKEKLHHELIEAKEELDTPQLTKIQNCPDWPLLGCFGNPADGWGGMMSARAEVFGTNDVPTHLHIYNSSMEKEIMQEALRRYPSLLTYSVEDI